MMKNKIMLGFAVCAGLFLCSQNVQANRLGQDVSSYQLSDFEYMLQRKQLWSDFTIVKLGGSGGFEGEHYQNPKASAQLPMRQKAVRTLQTISGDSLDQIDCSRKRWPAMQYRMRTGQG